MKNATKINSSCYDICEINQTEIVVYGYESGKIYGWNDFLFFYNRKNNFKTDTIKVGDGEGNNKRLKKINDTYIILQHNSKFYLLDIIKKRLKQKISLYTSDLSTLIKLNDDTFLVKSNSYEICQYRINFENKPAYKSSKDFGTFNIFMKYPEDRIIVINENNISLYGMK